jgi:hypothetical protein
MTIEFDLIYCGECVSAQGHVKLYTFQIGIAEAVVTRDYVEDFMKRLLESDDTVEFWCGRITLNEEVRKTLHAHLNDILVASDM